MRTDSAEHNDRRAVPSRSLGRDRGHLARTLHASTIEAGDGRGRQHGRHRPQDRCRSVFGRALRPPPCGSPANPEAPGGQTPHSSPRGTACPVVGAALLLMPFADFANTEYPEATALRQRLSAAYGSAWSGDASIEEAAAAYDRGVVEFPRGDQPVSVLFHPEPTEAGSCYGLRIGGWHCHGSREICCNRWVRAPGPLVVRKRGIAQRCAPARANHACLVRSGDDRPARHCPGDLDRDRSGVPIQTDRAARRRLMLIRS
jgi:hypothetical protein